MFHVEHGAGIVAVVNPRPELTAAMALVLGRLMALSGRSTLLVDLGAGAMTAIWDQPLLAEGAIDRALQEGSGSLGLLVRSVEIGLDLLPHEPVGPEAPTVDLQAWRAGLQDLRGPYSCVVLDLGSAATSRSRAGLDLADRVVSAPLPAAPGAHVPPIGWDVVPRVFFRETPSGPRPRALEEVLEEPAMRRMLPFTKELVWHGRT